MPVVDAPAFQALGSLAATVVDRARPARLPHRYVRASADGEMSLLEVGADGDADPIGPAVTREEAEAMARALLEAAGPKTPLPVTMHKLALAYLAAIGVERLGPAVPHDGARKTGGRA